MFVSVSKSDRFLGIGRRSFFFNGCLTAPTTNGYFVIVGWILLEKSVPVTSLAETILFFSPPAVTAVSSSRPSPSQSVVRPNCVILGNEYWVLLCCSLRGFLTAGALTLVRPESGYLALISWEVS